MSRAGIPNVDLPQTDEHIPFPRFETPTSCRHTPELFLHDFRDTSPETKRRIEQARTHCTICPHASACLKWALAHPDMTPTGIWAGTTARQRTVLRRRLVDRLGTDWVDVVAEADRTRRDRTAARPRTLSAGATS
ncbi:WhiB family transcriptional regulator [Streptomyces sp. NPDC046237]|uniref:WhiB family transcriptional regulator n=1 Tax=Streptomyces sp. NPDC046237 TaxID=3154914 RepID=UPI00340EF535